MEKFQISLAAARVNAEFTQEEAARIMGVDRSTIRRWEKYEKIPNYDESERLANLYGVSLDNIFFGKRTRQKRENIKLKNV